MHYFIDLDNNPKEIILFAYLSTQIDCRESAPLVGEEAAAEGRPANREFYIENHFLGGDFFFFLLCLPSLFLFYYSS